MSYNKKIAELLEQAVSAANLPTCPKGQRWCPVTKKCIPDVPPKGQGQRMARGGGKGPMGVPKKNPPGRGMGRRNQFANMEEIFSVDNPEFETVEKHIDFLVDMAVSHMEENELKSEPAVDPEEEFSRLQYDVGGYDKYGKKGTEDYESPSNMMSVGETLENALTEKSNLKDSFRKFFKNMMKKQGISSIKDLPKSQKKIFFDKIDRGWKAKNETD